jgi:hypothetical protein
LYYLVGIDDLQRWELQTPANYFGSLGARFGGEERGNRRGDRGLFIMAAGALIWRGSEWNLREGGGYCSDVVTGVRFGWRKKKASVLTRGPLLSAG